VAVDHRGNVSLARERELEGHHRRAAKGCGGDKSRAGTQPCLKRGAVAEHVAHQGGHATAEGVAKQVQLVPEIPQVKYMTMLETARHSSEARDRVVLLTRGCTGRPPRYAPFLWRASALPLGPFHDAHTCRERANK